MKKILGMGIVFFAMLIFPGICLSASSELYLGGHIGMTFLLDSEKYGNSSVNVELDFDPGFNFGLSGGYHWRMFRLEGEFQYQKNNIDSFNVCLGRRCISGVSSSGDVTMVSLLANTYIDFVNKTNVTPYITAGIGSATVKVNDFEVAGLQIGNSDDTVFAYQIGAGIAYAINEKFTIELKYRYHDIAELDFDGIKIDFANHDAYVGLRYYF
ncbi:MAG: porin family protein [Syntrophaceae bacterium]|nr:porin family protein [Syntrophaceae bacterium]